MEQLESRMLLSGGVSTLDDQVKVPFSTPFVSSIAQPDGKAPQGFLAPPPSILDPTDLGFRSEKRAQGNVSEAELTVWHLDVLSDLKTSTGFVSAFPAPSPGYSPSLTGPPATTPDALNPEVSGPTRATDPSNSVFSGPPVQGIIQEIPGTHSTRSSAQALPRQGATEIEAHWSPGDKLDLYQISMIPNSEMLHVEFHAPDFVKGSPDYLVVYDGEGRVLGDQALPITSTGLSLLLSALSQKDKAETIYLGVYSSQTAYPSASDASDATYESAPYVLDVSLVATPSAAPGVDTSNGNPSTTEPSGFTPLDVPAQSDSGSGHSGVSTTGITVALTPESLTLTQSIAVPQKGSLAPTVSRPSTWRSVAPLGGALSTRITQGVDRRSGAYVDLSLLSIPEDDAETGQGFEEEVQTTHPTVEPRPAIGGLPVLGATLPAVRVVDELASASRSAEHAESRSAVMLDASAKRARQTQERDSGEAGKISVTSDSVPDRHALNGRPRTPGLLRTGVGLAYVLAFTCLLPDLSAAFQAASGRKRSSRTRGSFRNRF